MHVIATTKAEISQEGKAFHTEEWGIMQNGPRQQTMKMFDKYQLTNGDERTT